MFEIKNIHARQVLDSRGNPTVEVEVYTDKGFSSVIVPSGASTGIHEAIELRDNDPAFMGKSVYKAIKNVNEIISKKLKGKNVSKQSEIDSLMIELDGTNNKGSLGANAIVGVSMACVRHASYCMEKPLYEYIADLSHNQNILIPVPFVNVINGGIHAGNELNIQEFMIVPSGAQCFKDAVQMSTEIYHTLKILIGKQHGKNAVNVGDEGGFAPPLNNTTQALDLLTKAIEERGYTGKVKLALDCAASAFYDGNKYNIDGRKIDHLELLEFYKELISKYPIVSIEDPYSEDDWEGFKLMVKELNGKIQIVGDDLLVTNPERIKKAISEKAVNTLLLKVNQIGTVSEAIKAAELAFENKWNVMVSHRSGDSEDSFIADLAVGLGCGELKSGAMCRSERNSKYNQLLRIEEKLHEIECYGLKTVFL